MNHVACDASVALKWLRLERELEVAESRAILALHVAGHVQIYVLDLALYEIANALIRKVGWSGRYVASRLIDLEALAIEIAPLPPSARTDAAELADRHELTFYDAAHWAFARALGIPLVTADRELVAAGGGMSPTAFAATL
jgi:predicted nucleic acid-binding protein